MRLCEFLDLDSVRPSLSAGNKRNLLSMIGQIAGQRLGIDPGAIVDSIVERERLGTTGFGGGVAIPHGKLDGLSSV